MPIYLHPLKGSHGAPSGCIGVSDKPHHDDIDAIDGPAALISIDPYGMALLDAEAEEMAVDLCRRWNNATGWQPIETAPKSGRVLVIGPGGTMHVANWSKNPFTGHEAWLVDRVGDDGTCLIMQATHWMPLPAPPEVVATDQGNHPQSQTPQGVDGGGLAVGNQTAWEPPNFLCRRDPSTGKYPDGTF